MRKAMPAGRQGFTLIEVLVVVSVLGIIMVTVTTVLVNSFKAKTRTTLADDVDQSGTAVLAELKNNILTAAGVGMSCVTNGVSVGSTLALINTQDGDVTNLVCYEGVKIASQSANGNFDLSSTNVKVTGCNNFARCDLFPDSTDRMTKINFSFNLSIGNSAQGIDKYVSRLFTSSVGVRE